MPITATTAVGPNFNTSQYVRAAADSQKRFTAEKVVHGARRVGSYGLDALNIIVGALLGIGSAIGATFFKDHTAADALSKGGIVASLIFIVNGIFKLVKANSANAQTEIPSTPCDLSSDDLANSNYAALNDLKRVDRNCLDPTVKDNDVIARIKSNPEIRTQLKTLYDKRTEALADLRDRGFIQHDDKYGSNYVVTGISVPDQNIPISQLKQEQALMIGHILGSRSDDAFDEASQAVTTTLPDLPEEFIMTCEAAKFFKEKYDSVKGEVQKNEEEIKTLASDPEQSEEYLTKVRDTCNYLRILNEAAKKVINSSKTVDPRALSQAAILRSALILAFDNLHGNSTGEIDRKIDKLFTGDGGIKAKTDEFEKIYTEITASLLKTEQFPYKIESGYNPAFSNLIRFDRKPV